MKPTINSDSVAQDQIRAFVERIMRMREEARAINADIREIYAEAKANGFDKTVLGKVVLYVEKRATKAAELLEAETVFDLYLEAFDGAVGTRVGTVNANTHTHETNTPEGSGTARKASGGSAPSDGIAGLKQGVQHAPPAHSQAKASAGNDGTNAPLDRAPVSGEASRLIGGSGTAEPITEPAAPATTPPGAIAADLSDEGTNSAQPEPLSSDAISEPDKSARPSGDGLAAPVRMPVVSGGRAIPHQGEVA